MRSGFVSAAVWSTQAQSVGLAGDFEPNECVAMVLRSAIALLASLRIDPVRLLGFSTFRFADGAVWQPFTYIFVNAPSFFTVLGLWCFYSWAMESERYLGRVRFLKLFALLLLVGPVVCG